MANAQTKGRAPVTNSINDREGEGGGERGKNTKEGEGEKLKDTSLALYHAGSNILRSGKVGEEKRGGGHRREESLATPIFLMY